MLCGAIQYEPCLRCKLDPSQRKNFAALVEHCELAGNTNGSFPTDYSHLSYNLVQCDVDLGILDVTNTQTEKMLKSRRQEKKQTWC